MKRTNKKAKSKTKAKRASAARKPALKPKRKTKPKTTARKTPTARAKATPAPKPKPKPAERPASELIDERICDLAGWRGETLARMRALIREADPEIAEQWKWAVPVWSHHGIVCTGETYKETVKLTFARGARVPDPSRLFNSSLEGNTRRAIDIHEGESLNADAFKALVKAAVAENLFSGRGANDEEAA